MTSPKLNEGAQYRFICLMQIRWLPWADPPWKASGLGVPSVMGLQHLWVFCFLPHGEEKVRGVGTPIPHHLSPELTRRYLCSRPMVNHTAGAAGKWRGIRRRQKRYKLTATVYPSGHQVAMSFPLSKHRAHLPLPGGDNVTFHLVAATSSKSRTWGWCQVFGVSMDAARLHPVTR